MIVTFLFSHSLLGSYNNFVSNIGLIHANPINIQLSVFCPCFFKSLSNHIVQLKNSAEHLRIIVVVFKQQSLTSRLLYSYYTLSTHMHTRRCIFILFTSNYPYNIWIIIIIYNYLIKCSIKNLYIINTLLLNRFLLFSVCNMQLYPCLIFI